MASTAVSGGPAKYPYPIRVTIARRADGKGLEVHPYTVHLDQRNQNAQNEDIVWECPSCEPFEVVFNKKNGSPFASPSFSHANPRSGLPQPAQGGSSVNYEYTVRVGGLELDPNVIVDR